MFRHNDMPNFLYSMIQVENMFRHNDLVCYIDNHSDANHVSWNCFHENDSYFMIHTQYKYATYYMHHTRKYLYIPQHLFVDWNQSTPFTKNHKCSLNQIIKNIQKDLSNSDKAHMTSSDSSLRFSVTILTVQTDLYFRLIRSGTWLQPIRNRVQKIHKFDSPKLILSGL